MLVTTTRERILTAAIACFGREGFAVGLREIGAEAGFSAALIIRHFGSKDGLRAACDASVRAQIVTAKNDIIVEGGGRTILQHLAYTEDYADLTAYVMQSLLDGGELARVFIDDMVADAEQYIADAESAGLMRPSRQPKARARYLTYAGLGAVLLQLTSLAQRPADLTTSLRSIMEEQLVPMLELYTEGIFTDRRYLDAVLEAGYLDHEPASKPVPHDVATDPPAATPR